MNIQEYFFEVIVALELLLLVVSSTNIYDSSSFTRQSIDPYELIKILPKVHCSKLSSEIESCINNNKKYVLNKMQQRTKPFEMIPFDERSVSEDEYDTMITDTSRFEIKRSNSPVYSLNCGCESKIDHTYLGSEYYPSFLTNMTCEQSLAMNSKPMRRIRCLPIYYPVKVLAPRMENEVDNEDTASLPHELRRCWKFARFNVVTGCRCGR